MVSFFWFGFLILFSDGVMEKPSFYPVVIQWKYSTWLHIVIHNVDRYYTTFGHLHHNRINHFPLRSPRAGICRSIRVNNRYSLTLSKASSHTTKRQLIKLQNSTGFMKPLTKTSPCNYNVKPPWGVFAETIDAPQVFQITWTADLHNLSWLAIASNSRLMATEDLFA